jgi:DNA-binding CsgD family transcriptional regulator
MPRVVCAFGEALQITGAFSLRSFAMIYFVSDGEYVKIGFTEDEDVTKRLKSLQTGNARELKIVGTIEGGYDTEVVLHRVFSTLRVRGEWFDLRSEAQERETLAMEKEVTERQRAILDMLRAGQTQADIAGELGVTDRTVRRDIAALNGAVKDIR